MCISWRIFLGFLTWLELYSAPSKYVAIWIVSQNIDIYKTCTYWNSIFTLEQNFMCVDVQVYNTVTCFHSCLCIMHFRLPFLHVTELKRYKYDSYSYDEGIIFFPRKNTTRIFCLKCQTLDSINVSVQAHRRVGLFPYFSCMRMMQNTSEMFTIHA